MSQNIETAVEALVKLRNTKGMQDTFATLYNASPKNVRDAVDTKVMNAKSDEAFEALRKNCHDDTSESELLSLHDELNAVSQRLSELVKPNETTRGRNSTKYIVHAVTIETTDGTLKVVLTV